MNKSFITFLKIAIPLGLGVFLIYYSYSKFTNQQIEEIATYFKKADYIVISLSVIFGILSHVSRAYRWNFMLEPLGYKPKFLNNAPIAIKQQPNAIAGLSIFKIDLKPFRKYF